MMYQSTRDASHKKYTAAEVIKMGLAPDGGLFIPETIPALSADEISTLRADSYPVRAAKILGKFLTDYTYEELQAFPLLASQERIPLLADVLNAVDGRVPLIPYREPEE